MMLLLKDRKYGSYHIFLLRKLPVKIMWNIFICRQTVAGTQMGVSSSSHVLLVIFWTTSMLCLVRFTLNWKIIPIHHCAIFLNMEKVFSTAPVIEVQVSFSDFYSFLFSGKVIDGLLVLRKIENVPTGPNNKPKIAVVITQSGEMWNNTNKGENPLHWGNVEIWSTGTRRYLDKKVNRSLFKLKCRTSCSSNSN